MGLGGLKAMWESLVRVIGVWIVVTGVVVTMILNDVLPWVATRSSTAFVAYHYFIGPGLLVAIGLYVAHRSTRSWVVAIGTAFLLWAGVSIATGCPGRACPYPEDYQHWRNIKLAVESGFGGPRLLISTESGACAFQCPYTIQLIPLATGYGALALGASTPRSESRDLTSD